MLEDWNSPIYAFFEPRPEIEYVDGRRTHAFKCMARGCKVRVRRYLDSKDRSSTGNLRRHAKSCWGEEAVDAACEAVNLAEARENIVGSILLSGNITASFARKKGKITYSHRQHTKAETRTEITGRPGYWLPSPSTVARDVKVVFARTRTRIAKMLQDYDGDISFATDAWTSPNHRAFVAITAHFIHEGAPMSILLDLVEVARSHSGVNLAKAF
ncbi:hypothetical protein K466DRAFT_501565, partial [Polyporus arcularius HHB13444]